MTTQTQNKLNHDFILLDRSGSMSSMWNEALGAVNGYVKKLAEDGTDTAVTLVVFDTNEPFKVIRDRIIPTTWKTVTTTECEPRGGTPLNDATAKLLDLAENGSPWGQKYDRVAIIVMTDGEENSSVEYRDPNTIRKRLDMARAKDWSVMYLGANFDNQKQATSYGTSYGQTIQTSALNLGSTMRSMASKRTANVNFGATMAYNSAEKTAFVAETLVSDEQTDKLAKSSQSS